MEEQENIPILTQQESQNSLECKICRVRFSNLSVRRLHHQSTFHRFNTKRKFMSLPPVCLDDFKILMDEVLTTDEKEKVFKYECDICRKIFKNECEFKCHFEEEDHKQKEIMHDTRVDPIEGPIMGTPHFESESVHDAINRWIENPDNLTNCLFCNSHSEDFENNLEHMKSAHMFTIPLNEYLKDREGLFKHLSIKIFIAHICIFCPFDEFEGHFYTTAEACQSHMRDKQHCKIDIFGNEYEYEKYFDFQSYFDTLNHPSIDKDKNLVVPGENEQKIVASRDNQGDTTMANRQEHGTPINRGPSLEDIEEMKERMKEKVLKTMDNVSIQKRERLNLKTQQRYNSIIKNRYNVPDRFYWEQ